MINVKNVSSALIVIALPDIHFRRELVPGRTIPISHEEYEAMMFDPGVMAMVEDHSLQFNGIEEEQVVAPAMNETIYEPNEIQKMLEEQNITKFAKFIPNAAPAEKDTVVKLAIDMGITNSGFVALIKKYCDVDVISAINTKHLVEE